jgi:ferredoxin
MSGIQSARRITLGVSLIGVTVLAFLHQRLQGIPSIDSIDPFGGLETLLKYVAGGELIKRIEPGTVVLLGAIVALGIVLSRFFCGWLCAFGALQGVFGWIGKKLFRRRFIVPAKADRVLRFAKYPILAAIIYFTWRAGELVIRPYDPMAAYGHLSAGLGAVWAEFAVGIIMLVVVLASSMLYERSFCKYLCPLGAVNAILGRAPILRIRRESSTCISCSKCDRVCPMTIHISQSEKVSSPECIACMECVTSCPTEKRTLSATLGGKAVKTGTVVIVGLAIYIGAALVGQGLGMLRFAPKSLKEQAANGALKLEDIKGSSTYAAVAGSFGIDLERLYREVGIDPNKVPPESMLKDTEKLAGLEGFEPDAVRVAVAKILGVPYAGEKGNLAPVEASATLKIAKNPESKAAGEPSLVIPSGFALEGTMSIDDIAKALGTSPSAVTAKLGLPSDIAVDKPLRDMKDEYGYSMPDLKARIKD